MMEKTKFLLSQTSWRQRELSQTQKRRFVVILFWTRLNRFPFVVIFVTCYVFCAIVVDRVSDDCCYQINSFCHALLLNLERNLTYVFFFFFCEGKETIPGGTTETCRGTAQKRRSKHTLFFITSGRKVNWVHIVNVSYNRRRKRRLQNLKLVLQLDLLCGSNNKFALIRLSKHQSETLFTIRRDSTSILH